MKVNEDLYRQCLESVCKAENKRMQYIARSTGIWPSQQDASSRGAMGGRTRRTVFFDPQDTHDSNGDLK